MDGDPIDFVIRSGTKAVAVIAVPKASDLAIKVAAQRVRSASKLTDWSSIVVLVASRSQVRIIELEQSSLIRTLRQRATVHLVHLKKRATGGYVVDEVD